jgi:hypothetical protein
MAPAIDVAKAKQQASRARTSVSAEAFGKYHKKQAFNPIVIKKSDQTRDK